MHFSRRNALQLAGAAALAAAAPAGARIEEGHIPVPGGKVWYRRIGGNRPGTPLLLLHGGPGAGHDYLLPMAALAQERPVIFYDQLGCGRSDAPETDAPYHLPRFVAEVDAVRRALGLDRIILFGNSWGTMLAIEYLLTGHGRGVEKLILSGALASVPQTIAGQQRLLDALPNGAGARLRALDAADQRQTPEYQKLVTMFYERHVCRRVPWPPEFVAAGTNLEKSPAYRIMNGPNEFTITGNIKHWDRRSDLGRITLPTLLTTGEYDEVTLDCHETIRDGVRGPVKLVVMPGCSHTTMIEQPERYNAILRAFIA
jgi:proline iminopeptidase